MLFKGNSLFQTNFLSGNCLFSSLKLFALVELFYCCLSVSRRTDNIINGDFQAHTNVLKGHLAPRTMITRLLHLINSYPTQGTTMAANQRTPWPGNKGRQLYFRSIQVLWLVHVPYSANSVINNGRISRMHAKMHVCMQLCMHACKYAFVHLGLLTHMCRHNIHVVLPRPVGLSIKYSRYFWAIFTHPPPCHTL